MGSRRRYVRSVGCCTIAIPYTVLLILMVDDGAEDLLCVSFEMLLFAFTNKYILGGTTTYAD